ncbi:uncharacterized protein LOC112041354 [Lingula anatina]|uniref:Uncharacterized protein LOC112041354 n=1 Tax=Lingula anatina TaxID=7574 RepID=A0A2R2MJ21_LINAN|nr:uncharacterized protein LOC112041354 [Lingula anatina]|eukprot:XP_023930203.1 uncharacterized protein LOC112041354 [Lingula anatina]
MHRWLKWYHGLFRQDACEARQISRDIAYRQIFVYTYEGNWNLDIQNFARFKEHHSCAGRKDNESIVAQGRKRIKIFEEHFGMKLPALTDQDLLDGKVPLLGGKLSFHPYHINPAAKCRVILDSNRHESRAYKNVPVSDAGWMVEALQTVNVSGPGFSGILMPGSAIFQGEFLFYTSRENPHGGKVLIQYESKTPSYVIENGRLFLWNPELFHPVYGKGRDAHVSELDPVTGRFSAREVLTFSPDA